MFAAVLVLACQKGVFVHGSSSPTGITVDMSRYQLFRSICGSLQAVHGIGWDSCCS